MESEGFDAEEWDADFLDQLVQAEELALSTQLSHHQHPPLPPEPPRPPPPPCDISYSPPRELSQRTHEASYTGGITDCFDSFAPRVTHSAKEQEIDRLKKELNRVSKQLNHLEQECLELRRARDKKEEQLKVIHSRIDAKDAEFHRTRNTETDCLVSGPTAPGTHGVHQNANSSNDQLGSWTKSRNTVGVQTDKTTEVSTSALQNGCCSSEKLIGLWNSDDQKLGRVLVTKLFMTCESDFHVLCEYLNSPQNDSDMALMDKPPTTQPIETTKVSQLYSLLTMISNDALRLEDLFEALMDLCNLKNVVIIHRSLRVLHSILSSSFTMEKEFGERGLLSWFSQIASTHAIITYLSCYIIPTLQVYCTRENVLVEEPFSGNTKSDINGCGNSENEDICFANLARIFKQGQIPCGLKLPSIKTPGSSGFSDHRFGASISGGYWVSLFERICQIAVKNNKEEIQHEALSILNLILMRQNAYLERDKFAGELVFRSISLLLGREAGFSVQDQAVHTLYLLCNCPKVISMLCSGFKEDGELSCSKDIDDKSFLASQELNDILIGLAVCVACHGSSSAGEMKLRRNAIGFLAFLGSSGKSGFEILLTRRLPKSTNFLQIILQSLISDLDLQARKSAHKSGVLRERWLLIREALILLNRLVSHPQYSASVLQALTSTRDMASMTVDIANRLTQKNNLLCQDDSVTKQIRESEIVDLAWVFKKRVFAFLGDSIS